LSGRVQKQLSAFQTVQTFHVYKLTGTFRRRTNRYGTVTSYRIGHHRVPGSNISKDADAVLKSRVHQEMTVEYIGELDYARSCYDAQGMGWSFIRRAAL
jgi:hypothetical protein